MLSAALSKNLLGQVLSEAWPLALTASARALSTGSGLKDALAAKIPDQQARLKDIKSKHGDVELGKTTVAQTIGGMRGIPGMLWETSLLDADEGIRFRGYSIPELQATLPAAVAGGEPLPEGLMWLMMTGDVPTEQQVAGLSRDLAHRAALPAHVTQVLAALPKGAHPMTQLSIGITAMQTDSVFAAAYQRGVHKSTYWEYAYEDSLNLIARLPALAASIYRNSYKGGNLIDADPDLDWAGNYAHQMGLTDPGALEMMRLYQTIHTDHEGGNVSAHTTHLVGSALSDPYLCLAAGVNGLAGPLHGLANQEVLKWLKEVVQQVGDSPSHEQLEEFLWATLKSGKVVPGFGHAVLRQTDPRYTCQRAFAQKHMPEYPLFHLVASLFEVAPKVLLATGKVKNPWPNVDAHSGVLLQYYGITEEDYYTVMFAVSRAIGVLTQGVWSRALGLPIERPKSMTMSCIEKACSGGK